MATVAQLRTRLQSLIQDSSFEDSVILGFFNEALSRVAAGIRMPDGSISPPLPDLFTSANVSALTSANSVAMPADFHRNLVFVYSTNNDDRLEMRDNIFGILNSDPGMDEIGGIDWVSRKGNTLYYVRRPSTTDVLTLRYYKKPTDLSTDSTIPSSLPDHLHYALLVNYAAMNIFEQLDRNAKKPTGRNIFYNQEFLKAMLDLVGWIGEPEAEPKNVLLAMEDDF